MPTDAAKIDARQGATASNTYCPSCYCDRPVTQFRIVERASGRRSRHCNCCHAQRERQRKRRVAESVRRAELHNAWSTLSRAAARRLAIESFVIELLRRHGGPAGLARDWADALREATAAKRLRACESVVVLLNHIQTHCQPSGLLDDVALADEHQRAKIQVITDALRDEPGLVRQLVARSGYELVPQ